MFPLSLSSRKDQVRDTLNLATGRAEESKRREVEEITLERKPRETTKHTSGRTKQGTSPTTKRNNADRKKKETDRGKAAAHAIARRRAAPGHSYICWAFRANAGVPLVAARGRIGVFEPSEPRNGRSGDKKEGGRGASDRCGGASPLLPCKTVLTPPHPPPPRVGDKDAGHHLSQEDFLPPEPPATPVLDTP